MNLVALQHLPPNHRPLRPAEHDNGSRVDEGLHGREMLVSASRRLSHDWVVMPQSRMAVKTVWC